MKTILFLVAIVIGVITGGLYYKYRKPESRVSDWQRFKSIPTNFKIYVKALFGAKPAADAAAPVQTQAA